MKRSMMLEYIKTFMDEDLGKILDDIEAEHILYKIEKQGMLPPKYIKSFGYIKDVAYSNVEVNEWEPEDAD